MKLSELTPDQYRKYFEIRLSDNKFHKSGIGYMALCPFHQDKTPSLSINAEKGVWKCHTGCGGGGILDFEKKFSSCDDSTAIARIAEVTGESQLRMGQQPEAVYDYTDAFGKLLFQVVRYPGKRFTQRQPDGNGGWIYKTQNLKMVLYQLPGVVTAKQVIVCEGEKDADGLREALGVQYPHLAVTTSPRGAGKWQDTFAPYFIGKQVLIIPDNDDAGRKHAQTVALSVHSYAQGVKILELPELSAKGDVSDYLKTHTAASLIELAKVCAWWKPAESDTSLFMTVTQFEQKAADSIEWMIEGVIQRGANGLFIARPKAGKSFAVLDQAIALASGQRWLDFFVPKRVRVALVSREDHYGLTQWREKKIRLHRGLSAEELDGWLYINAKGLRPKFMLDNPDEVSSLITDLKRYQSEFLILDVMRVLHSSEENDNTEMQKVIDVLNKIQDATGAQVCLIHHDNKREDATLTERARGASAISGYAEFITGIRVVDDTTWTRQFECELKASMAPEKFYWRITDTADDGIKLERVTWEPPSKGRKKSSHDDATAFPWGGESA
jgi:putative DNA primase/helicase